MRRSIRSLLLISLLSCQIMAVLVFTPALAGSHVNPDGSIDLVALRETIAELGLTFTVEENRFTRMTVEERLRLGGAFEPRVLGLIPDPPAPLGSARDSYFNWRDIGGNSYVSGVRDQGNCGSCWAFGTLAMLESALMISQNLPNTDPDYSEQYMLSCIDDAGWPGNDCDGGNILDASEFMEAEGTPTENCFPYVGDDQIPCADACPDAGLELRYFESSAWVTTSSVDIEAINAALQYGPVGTWFEVWNSFFGYSGGIYSAYGSDYSGGSHFVLIVGHDDENSCWIAKNSWSEVWGEDGFFRIAYDSGCEFGCYTRSCVFDDDCNPIIVHEPNAETVWCHGQSDLLVHYYGSSGASIKVDIYRDGFFLENFLPWTDEAGGYLLRTEPVPEHWEISSNFKLYLENDLGEIGWSERFLIQGEPEWEDATAAPLNDPGESFSASWVDYDNDGALDLYLTKGNESNRLFHNDGNGNFSDDSAPPLDVNGASRGQAWADPDNDGDLDLYLALTSGQSNYYFVNLGEGVFVDQSAAPLDDDSFGWGATWGDYNADGLVDLYVANAYAADKIFRNEGGGVFTDATIYPFGDTGNGRTATWTDFDNDGDLDCYLVRNGSNRVYVNQGDGSFTTSAQLQLCDGGNGYGSAWGDYDCDGDLDVFLVNSGQNRLLRNDGAGDFSDVTAGDLLSNADSRGAVWFDYDNDGRLDLYIVNHGANQLCRNLGGDLFEAVTQVLLSGSDAGEGVACADYDGDGRLDLYLVNSDAENKLFRNTSGEGRHWLQLRLVGGESNRAAVGAKLRLVVGEQAQLREIGSETAGLSRSSLDVEFGLGTADLVDSLQVFWPSGWVETFIDLPVDQIRVINEGVTAAGEAPPSVRTQLLANHPNPFNPKTSIAFVLARSQGVRLAVHDLGGRRLILLVDQVLPPGRNTVVWDGRDDDSRPLASGVYFVRMETAEGRFGRKLVMIR